MWSPCQAFSHPPPRRTALKQELTANSPWREASSQCLWLFSHSAATFPCHASQLQSLTAQITSVPISLYNTFSLYRGHSSLLRRGFYSIEHLCAQREVASPWQCSPNFGFLKAALLSSQAFGPASQPGPAWLSFVNKTSSNGTEMPLKWPLGYSLGRAFACKALLKTLSVRPCAPQKRAEHPASWDTFNFKNKTPDL